MTDPAHVISATYRVVTPMFLSGADQDAAELRIPSIKGALRFWWRALANERNLAELRRKEDELFGSTRTGTSKIRMRLRCCATPIEVKKGKVLTDEKGRTVGDGARYLGYGVMEAFASRKKGTEAGQLTRPCLSAPFEFSLELCARGLDTQQQGSLHQALKALGTLGGLGSKSRKGYGSLKLQEIRHNDAVVWADPGSVDALVATIRSFYAGAPRHNFAVPSYTAFSDSSRHVVMIADKESPLRLLDHIGREMIRFRSWGHNGKVLGEDSERNFKGDHDLMKMPIGKRETHPQRIAFGLPHNYGKEKSDQVPLSSTMEQTVDRRASPLVLHMHEVGTQAVAVLSFFPAEFLPGGPHSRISVGGAKVPVTPHPKIWQPVEEFLDRLVTGKDRKEPIGNVLEIRP